MKHEITREIGIDAGHRVTHHGSKCKNLHGHRYTIQATCRGALVESGASEGMVLDFGFLKDSMMRVIDEPCDHGLILWVKDPLLTTLWKTPPDWNAMCATVARQGCAVWDGLCGKIYIVDFVPTAECLAKHWFYLLADRVQLITEGKAKLICVRVWETPNSYADFACE